MFGIKVLYIYIYIGQSIKYSLFGGDTSLCLIFMHFTMGKYPVWGPIFRGRLVRYNLLRED